MPKSISEITQEIDQFSNARGWNNDDPSDLVNSVYIEMGELAEHFQWKHEFSKLTKVKEIELGYEFVDVIFYLFRLASKAGIDVEKYFNDKLPKLAKKFPIGSNPAKQHKKYRKLGKNKRYE